VVLPIDTLRSAPPALGRLVLRRALAEGAGLRGVAMTHVERILEVAASPRSSGRRVPLPGGREAVFNFREVGIGPRAAAPRAFSLPVPVPGRVPLPGGETLVARSCRGPAASQARSAVVAMDPGEPLVVRTRQPGDRLRTIGREVSLRRFLMERRVPADQRLRLPLVASGQRVLWVPGQPIEPPAEAGRGFVRLELEGQP
jgi:tRNA(Ile)-lysidine synthetase-like protein